MKGESYEKLLERSLGFSNPNNTTYLANLLGLDHRHYSNIQGMRGRFSEQEYATELRQVQASKWAFKSVSEGIDHFKSGRLSEAFQSLNKALHIDPRNVEGLVARGALYANNGNFNKAIEDFENALKLNQNHQNARKYMGETLVALGRSFEDENKFDDALKSYENCLALIPFHEEAQNSVDFLKSKINSKLNEADVSSKTLEAKETLKNLLKVDDDDEKKDKDKDRSRSKKKKDRKSRKRRRRSSTSSSSSSSGSSHSSSSSSSSSSDSSSGSSHSESNSHSPTRSRKAKKHKKRSKKEEKKDKSLSPLSKRMALMDPSRLDAEGLTGLLAQQLSHYNPPALPFAFTRSAAAAYPEAETKDNDYEQRVCRFLEQTKGDSEYEEKVRKFLDETARWKKERKSLEEKTGKKKKRKDKKSREKDKGKKKKDHDKKKKHRGKKGDKLEFDEHMDSKKFREALRKELGVKEDPRKRKPVEDDEEFLYGHGGDKKDFRLLGLENLPDLDDLQTKLSAYYAKVEKGTGLSKGRNEDRPDKKRHLSPKVMYVHHDENEDKNVTHGREKKKNLDMFADTSTMSDSKNKLSAAETTTLMNSKWKMQIGSVGSKIKKREKGKFDHEPWEDVDEKRFSTMRDDEATVDSDEELQKKRKKLLEEKVQAKKAAMLEASEKRVLEKQKKDDVKRDDGGNKSQPFVSGKFQGGFKSISTKALDRKNDDLPPLPPGMPPKIQFPIRSKAGAANDVAKALRNDDGNGMADSDKKKKRHEGDKKKESGGSSRSRSKSRGKYSRSSSKSRSIERRRSRSGSYVREGSRSRSRSYPRYRSSASRSRSRSYRSRSFNSRSRSRSDEGHYRRRSRSHSDDRRRRDYHQNKYQGRYPRNRGTYYRPRFQNYKNPRGGFVPRGGRNFHPKFMHGRSRPFIHRGRGRGGNNNQGRFFHYKRGQGYNKDYHNRERRYDRPRSRDSDDRRSYSREDEDPMKKVDAAKEKINKYLADEDKKDTPVQKRSKDDPLSEGEERDDDDYPPLPPGTGPGYVDRKVYEGKWAEKDPDDRGASVPKLVDAPLAPPENSIEEMDKFLTKVKAQKKEEMKERNKSFMKTNPW